MLYSLLLQSDNPIADLINDATRFVNELMGSTLLFLSAVSMLVGIIGVFGTIIFAGWRMWQGRKEGMSLGKALGTLGNAWAFLIIFLLLVVSPTVILALTGNLQNFVNSLFGYFT